MLALNQVLASIGGTAVLIGVVVWFARNLILVRVKNAVAHEFNTKLEALKNDLRSKEAEIASIRDMAATLAAGRDQAVEVRRLQAIDEIWEGFRNAKKYSWAVNTLGTMNLTEVANTIENDPKLQKFFETLHPGEPKSLDLDVADLARPWVSGLAWAYFSAYSSMVAYCNLWVHTAKIGLNPEKFVKREHVNKLLAVAIPEVTFDADKDNSHLYVSAGKLLETKMIVELRSAIRGEELDAEMIERARKIAEAANSVDTNISKVVHEVSRARTEV